MIHREDRDDIAVMRFDHGKAHAFDVEFTRALRDQLADVEECEDVRAIVITGTGTIFSAGVDLFRLVEEGPQYADEFVPLLVDTFYKLFVFPRPVVAAVNGHAIAGGCVLAAACDYRIMAEGDGTIGAPELRVGVPFPAVALEILRFATSTAHLQELVYRGKTYAVAEAYERGLVDETISPERLLDHACSVATRLASEPTARFRITKRQLRRPAIDLIERHASETDREVLAEWKDPETIQAIRAYLEEFKKGQ